MIAPEPPKPLTWHIAKLVSSFPAGMSANSDHCSQDDLRVNWARRFQVPADDAGDAATLLHAAHVLYCTYERDGDRERLVKAVYLPRSMRRRRAEPAPEPASSPAPRPIPARKLPRPQPALDQTLRAADVGPLDLYCRRFLFILRQADRGGTGFYPFGRHRQILRTTWKLRYGASLSEAEITRHLHHLKRRGLFVGYLYGYEVNISVPLGGGL